MREDADSGWHATCCTLASMRQPTLALGGALLALACTPSSTVPPDGPPALAGGTLHLTEGGRYAIASDPDRASIHVVHLTSREELHTIELAPEDEPGRIAEDAAGRVHVVLRRAGEVLSLDPESGDVLERRAVCRAPRGIDYDEGSSELVVACAEGSLVRLPAAGGGVASVLPLEPDLRDVIVRSDGTTLVSVFRSAEVLVVRDGVVASRIRPASMESTGFTPRSWVPTVAWRMREHPDGAILVHQHSASSQLGTLGVPSGVYYGGDCLNGVVRSVVSIVDVESGTARSIPLDGLSLVVDGAYAGGQIYLAAAAEPGNATAGFGITSLTGLRRVSETEATADGICIPVWDQLGEERPVTGVAVTSDGQVVAQYREPGTLAVGAYGSLGSVALAGGSALHFGHSIFHEAAGSGATCASCHPEGGDDGHVWRFDVGARRTQTLRGGILETAPFHWSGDVVDGTRVMEGTFVGRMGGARPHDFEIAAFEEWVDALPALPAPDEERAAAERGRALFDASGCGDCHSGRLGTNNQTVDVGTGGRFNVPSLYELVYRAPYLHDGRAATLEGVVGTHGDTGALTDAQRGDLATYLRTL